ncbi:MAG: metal-dependent transcriptional regulator [Lachnospiraceae bacterium]|nr:metal-dependent transcriptional regulator [Lachnospiraceae bacterium]
MEMQESGEMYLETILILSEKMDTVRAIDIVKEMGFSKPSVSRAMGILKEGKFIKISDNGEITLTAKGKARAEMIYERHTVIAEMLMRIGVSEQTAIDDACRVEHYISEETFEALRRIQEKRKKNK